MLPPWIYVGRFPCDEHFTWKRIMIYWDVFIRVKSEGFFSDYKIFGALITCGFWSFTGNVPSKYVSLILRIYFTLPYELQLWFFFLSAEQRILCSKLFLWISCSCNWSSALLNSDIFYQHSADFCRIIHIVHIFLLI